MTKDKFIITEGSDSIKDGAMNLYSIRFDLFNEKVSVVFTTGSTGGDNPRPLSGPAYSFALESLEDPTFLADLKMIMEELGERVIDKE